MKISELLSGRSIGFYPIGEVKSPAQRLVKILPQFGLTSEQVGQAIKQFIEDDVQDGPGFRMRRITKTTQDRLRALAKKKLRRMDPKTEKWLDEEIDGEDFTYLRLGYAILDPEFPDGMELPSDETCEAWATAMRKRADYLAGELSTEESVELLHALKDLNSFILRRAEAQVKN